MSLRATIRLRVGDLALDVELHAPAGAVTAVLGPNGAGKTTLLRALAGHVRLDDGAIVIGDRVVDEPPHTFVPAERRRLGTVHQDHLLFPHLRAVENVAFGPRAAGVPAARARDAARAMLERVGVGDCADRKPSALSGGQAQRVALARALATEPEGLLLDEPLAALDAGTRVDVRRDLRRHLAAFPGPTVLVTHDPVDVLVLADHVAILDGGRVTQAGTVAEVTARPRSRYVADLIGTNLVRGTAAGTVLTTDDGATLTLAEPSLGPVFATIPPAAIAVHRAEPQGSPRNRWTTTVEHLDVAGDRVRVGLAEPLPLTAEITAVASAELGLREGDQVWVTVKATEITTYLA